MNWGYKLTFVFIAFASMMGYMVFRCYNTNFELVEKEYYKSELRYQEVIDGQGQANTLSAAPIFTQNAQGVVLQMPVEMHDPAVSGNVLFYCAYDSKKDRHQALSLDKNGSQSFDHLLTPGHYRVKMDWSKDGKKYYTEKDLTIL